MKRLYFAHPMSMYHTVEEAAILDLVKGRFSSYEIINPADVKVEVVHKGCRQCMQEIMRPIFFKCIAKCDRFLLWDVTGSCGVRCELHEAWRLNKDVIQVEFVPHLKDIELQSYHYAHRRLDKGDT